MNARTARETSVVLGWLMLTATAMQFTVIGFTVIMAFKLRGAVGLFSLFEDIWMMLTLSTIAAVFLIQRQNTGFFIAYVAAVFSTFSSRFNVLPGLNYIVPKAPEADYYYMAMGAAVALLLAYCHWRITSEAPPRTQKRERTTILVFLVALAAALIHWKSGIRTGNGEVAKVSEIPMIGSMLEPLESTQPILYRDVETRGGIAGTIVFRGATTEENFKKFVEAQELRALTNDAARVKMFPITKNWKLDPQRFPIFTNATDLCYTGRIPKTERRTILQIAFRPGDDRFTALAMKLLPKPQPSP